MNFHNAIAGLLIGTLVGLTGMGGGSLMAPILIYVFHFQAKVAVGSDLVYLAIAKMFGAVQHKRQGTVDTKLAGYLAVGSVPSSLLGVWLLHHIDKTAGAQAEHILEHVLGGTLILVAAIMIARSVPEVEERLRKHGNRQPPRGPKWAILVGVLGGFLVGLTSVGGGVLFGVALLLVFGLGARRMVGTDIFHAAILSAAAALGHIAAGDVNYPLVGSLLVGAIPGILIGGRLTMRVPERALRPTLGAVLLVTGVLILHPVRPVVARPIHKSTRNSSRASFTRRVGTAQVASASSASPATQPERFAKGRTITKEISNGNPTW